MSYGWQATSLTVTGPVTLPPKVMALTGSRTNGRAEGIVDTMLPLASFPAGKHVRTLEARLANGESARRMVAFDIESSR